jgi:hypothetical protein
LIDSSDEPVKPKVLANPNLPTVTGSSLRELVHKVEAATIAAAHGVKVEAPDMFDNKNYFWKGIDSPTYGAVINHAACP